MVHLRVISDKLIINLDQTGTHLVPTGDWTIAVQESRRVEMVTLGDKQQVTAALAACRDGTFLGNQVLYQSNTAPSHPNNVFLNGFDIFHTPNHWTNEHVCAPFKRSFFGTSNTQEKPWVQHPRRLWSWWTTSVAKLPYSIGRDREAGDHSYDDPTWNNWLLATSRSQHKQGCQRVPMNQVSAVVRWGSSQATLGRCRGSGCEHQHEHACNERGRSEVLGRLE